MTIQYHEFDTTSTNLVADLKTKILANPAWSAINVTPVSTTLSASTSANGNTATLTSVAGLTVGQWITLSNSAGSSSAQRQIIAISGNTITINTTWLAAYASGSPVVTKNTIVKATTDRGADIILDLDGADSTHGYLGLALYRQWNGTVPGGQVDPDFYHIWYRSSAFTASIAAHVILSISKNHLYISVEGPRAYEASASNTTYGSLRNYFAVSDLVPYHANDTVPAIIGMGTYNVSAPSVTLGSFRAGISRDSTNTYSWTPGRLGTIDFPVIGAGDVVTLNRNCTIDGKTYLFPYVMSSLAEGIRGRLSHFFYAGTNAPSPATDVPEPVGSKVTYDGVVYKLLAVNKGDGVTASTQAWGPLGAALNTNGGPNRSVVVAVPFADAA